jgi:hypothetical protein
MQKWQEQTLDVKNILWNTTPYGPLKVNNNYEQTYDLPLLSRWYRAEIINNWRWSFSDTQTDNQRTGQYYIPKESTLHTAAVRT